LILELIIIACAIFFEAVQMSTGDPKKLVKIFDRFPVLRVIAGLAAHAYLILAVVWCFCDPPIRWAGLTLVTLSIVAVANRVRGVKSNLMTRVDACISLVCLLLAAYYKVVF